jgi:hypothetical protein
MDCLTSKERIIGTICLEDVDRVPITLYEINPYLRDWRSLEPSYADLLRWAHQLQDTFALAFVEDPNFTFFLEAKKEGHDPYYYRPLGNLGVLLSSSEEIKTRVTEKRIEKSTFFEQVIETSKGPLRTVYRVEDGVATTWQMEPLLKTIGDVDKLLSLPYEPANPDLSRFFATQEALGDRAVMVLSMSDPVAMGAQLFKYENFLFYALSKKAKILELFDFFHERLCDLYRRVARTVSETVFRIIGPEAVAPPAMSPKYFEDLVVRYDQELIGIIKKSRNFACIHCHGKLKSVVDKIAEMQPDMLEPIEPPPYGDITLTELKKRIGDETCLMGYMEFSDLETCTTREINKKVKEAVEEGAPGGGYILLPSATPIKFSMPRRIEASLIQFLKSGRKYGGYPK